MLGKSPLTIASIGILAILGSLTAKARNIDNHALPAATGWIASTDVEIGSSGHFLIYRDVNRHQPRRLILTDYLPPVGYQGRQKSCVPWSIAYYAYSYGVAERLKLAPTTVASDKYRFSPAFLYHLCNHGIDSGVSFKAAFDALQAQGCATIADMPYNDRDFSSPPSPKAKAEAEGYRPGHVGVLFSHYQADPDSLRTFLVDTGEPFSIGFTLYADFPLRQVPANYIYDHTGPVDDRGLGGHAVAVVGYDKDKHAFLIVNSWGTHWGQKGFLWVSERFMRQYAREGWAVSPGEMAAAAPSSNGTLTTREFSGVWQWTSSVLWLAPRSRS